MTETEPVADHAALVGYPLEEGTLLYHWSPSERRESITARGLRIRSESPHAPIRYPYIALAPDPLDAWAMSGGSFVLPGVPTWDLWGVYAGDIRAGFEVIPRDDMTVREVRTYRSIPARWVRYIGSRPADGLR